MARCANVETFRPETNMIRNPPRIKAATKGVIVPSNGGNQKPVPIWNWKTCFWSPSLAFKARPKDNCSGPRGDSQDRPRPAEYFQPQGSATWPYWPLAQPEPSVVETWPTSENMNQRRRSEERRVGKECRSRGWRRR